MNQRMLTTETKIIFGMLCLTSAAIFGCRGSNRSEPDPPSKESKQPPESSSASARVETINGRRFQTASRELEANVEAWPSEAFAGQAAVVLNQIKKKINVAANRPGQIESMFMDSFECGTRPVTHSYRKENLTVLELDQSTETIWKKGALAISEFLQQLVPPNANSPQIRMLKVVEVDLGETIATKLRLESFSSSAGDASQLTQYWKCQWTMENRNPKLAKVELISANLVHRLGPAPFSDATLSVLGRTKSYQQQLQFGLQHWLARIETAHGMNYFSKHGLAIADVNGDGLDDLYVCQPAGIPNRLFIQSSDGAATDQSARFGIDLLDRTASAIFVDLDNDGDQDAAIATLMGVQVFENDRGQRFQRRVELSLPDIDLQGISAVDYDNDGDLDLYQLVDYASDASRARQGLPSFVYHNANDGGANRLLQNNIDNGNWQFADVTLTVGLNVNNQRHSLAAAWEDFDNDGDQDLYVANDYGPNCLYQNDRGQFTEVANRYGVVDFGSGMSVSWGDYDRDGWMDLYVANMYSSAGNRISPQEQFLPNLNAPGRLLYTRFAKGNSMFRNQTGNRFEETGAKHHVEMARWAWGSMFSDMNNDGHQDLLVANGYITTPDSGDL